MTTRTRLLTIAGAGLLTLAIAVTAVAGGGPAGALAAPGTPGTTATATGQNPAADFLAKLAANLGIGQDRLSAAVKQTDLQQIDAAQAAGQLTADQAQAARDRVNDSPDGVPPFGIGGPRGGEGRGHGGQGALLDAAATVFGVGRDQLAQDLATAGSLQGVAAKYGKDTAADKATLETALEAALRQDLMARGVAAAQIDQQVTQFRQNFDQFYTQPFGHGGPRDPQAPGSRPGTTPGAPATPRPTQ